MPYEITSFVGVGDLKLGMTSKEVRRVFKKTFKGKPEILMNRTEHRQYPTECYGHIFVYYGSTGKVDGLELTDMENVLYGKIDIFSDFKDDVISQLRKKSPNFRHNDAGFYFLDIGISLYIPYEDEGIKAVLVFEKGYWDD